MPENKNAKVVPLPMVQKWGKQPETEFVNNLDSIKITLMNSPSLNDLRSYMGNFLDATWAETPYDADKFTVQQKDELILECIKGKALPTALETIGLVWRIEGISLQEVTHILRYRNASFSADCSADKWWTDKRALVPNSIQNSNGISPWGDISFDSLTGLSKDDFNGRYEMIVKASKQLYVDMIDSKKVSILDARMILPRCLETFYYMRMNLQDVMHFIFQRIDKQIQPETDNIIAYYMYLELLKRYPIMNGVVDIHAPSSFYIKMHDSGRTSNIYLPDEDSDKFDWNPESFIYQKHRNEMNGTDEDAINKFEELAEQIENQIKAQERFNEDILSEQYAGLILLKNRE